MPILPIEHIDTKPESGIPRIAGTRFTVPIVVATLRNNPTMTSADYAEEFGLTLGQVYAALSYYYDHQAEIDHFYDDLEPEIQAGLQHTAEMNQRIHERMTTLHNEQG